MKHYFDRIERLCFQVVNKFYGEEVQLKTAGGELIPARGVFTTEPIEIGQGEQIYVSSDQPVLKFYSADFETQPKQGDEIIVRQINYKVKEVKHYNSMSMLLLARHNS